MQQVAEYLLISPKMENQAEAVPRVFGALTLSTIARRFGRLAYSSRRYSIYVSAFRGHLRQLKALIHSSTAAAASVPIRGHLRQLKALIHI